jgi:hypothetical protein
MQGLRFRTNPPYGGAVEILCSMYYSAQMRTNYRTVLVSYRMDIAPFEYIENSQCLYEK